MEVYAQCVETVTLSHDVTSQGDTFWHLNWHHAALYTTVHIALDNIDGLFCTEVGHAHWMYFSPDKVAMLIHYTRRFTTIYAIYQTLTFAVTAPDLPSNI